MTGAQTLRLVYGLLGSMKAVIGAEWLPIICGRFLTIFSQDGKASTNSIQQDLGMCLTRDKFVIFSPSFAAETDCF